MLTVALIFSECGETDLFVLSFQSQCLEFSQTRLALIQICSHQWLCLQPRGYTYSHAQCRVLSALIWFNVLKTMEFKSALLNTKENRFGINSEPDYG